MRTLLPLPPGQSVLVPLQAVNLYLLCGASLPTSAPTIPLSLPWEGPLPRAMAARAVSPTPPWGLVLLSTPPLSWSLIPVIPLLPSMRDPRCVHSPVRLWLRVLTRPRWPSDIRARCQPAAALRVIVPRRLFWSRFDLVLASSYPGSKACLGVSMWWYALLVSVPMWRLSSTCSTDSASSSSTCLLARICASLNTPCIPLPVSRT